MAQAAGVVLAASTVAMPAANAATQAPAATWSPGPATYQEGARYNVGVRMADGTVLRADVYYPTDPGSGRAAAGPFPVLLQQTPYGKEAIGQNGAALANTDVPYLVDRGYIVVIADVRGTGDSGGTWGLFDPVQGRDGATLARWAAALPHSDGKVGLFGESYMGINQFLTVAAAGAGSPIKAMFPIISGHDIYSDTVTSGGIPDVEFSSAYLALVGGLNAANPVAEPLSEAAAAGSLSQLGSLAGAPAVEAQHARALMSTDVSTLASVETGGSQAYDGPYWARRSPASYLRDVVDDHIPAFLVGGWNDLFQQGEPLNYAALQNLSDGLPADAPMQAGQAVTPRYQLMMGPWMHVTTGSGVNMAAVELEWFDTWLRGRDTPLAHTKTPLHLYQLGSGRWVDTSTWPLTGTTATAFYFGAGGAGRDPVSTNHGSLVTAAPTAATGADQVLWSPMSSPCDVQSDQWSAGAASLALSYLQAKNPCDTNDASLGAGPDALTYTSAPFGTAQDIAGPIDATVYATATTTDTELAATVEEVSPSGRSVPLTAGALLGSLRQVDRSRSWVGSNGRYLLADHPLTRVSSRPVVPGRVTRYDITVFPTFARIPAGWRLRVTLTTADTPHLAPSAAQLPHLLGGVYSVQRTAAAASYLNVPLVPAGQLDQPCGSLCSPAGP
ncbi:MAG TPA: CocE/NonD family hydrolase [Acidimicrobiales bacterium]|nr:CocE/NonD family hydrolase [Acidimicrobiales bacterium]